MLNNPPLASVKAAPGVKGSLPKPFSEIVKSCLVNFQNDSKGTELITCFLLPERHGRVATVRAVRAASVRCWVVPFQRAQRGRRAVGRLRRV